MIDAENEDLGEGYFTNGEGDLLTLDKDGNEMVVVAGGNVQAHAMSHLEGSVEWSVHYSHRDFDGKKHLTTHSVADLHTNHKTVLRGFLSKGLRLMAGRSKQFMHFLITHLPAARYIRVSRSGWLEKSWVYVQPNWCEGDPGEKIHLELEKNCPTISSMNASGTLEEWQQNVAAPLQGNSLAMFCLLFAFLGPMLKILGLEGGGFHVVGRSSIGKTTGLQCAASVYGCGASPSAESGLAYTQAWNQTSNALEGLAAGHTDACTLLDEIKLYAGNDLGSDLYLLAGGRGKGAMDSQRKLREVSTWRGSILSTGEMGILEAIQQKGGRAKAGMMVRLVDIPVANMFPNPPDGMSSGEFSNWVKAQCGTYYGTAGRAFVSFLVDQLKSEPGEVITGLRATLEEFWKELIPAEATSIQERAIRRFAAVRLAGHAAIEAGILPYTADDVDNCVSDVMGTWLTYRPSVTDVQRSLAVLQDFLVRNSAALPSFTDCRAVNPKAFRQVSRGLFAFTDAQFAAATGAENLVEVAKELRSQGYLFCNETGRLKAKLKIIGDAETRFYAVKRTFIEADLQRTDIDESVLVEPE